MNRRQFIKQTLNAAAILGFYPVLSYAALEKFVPKGKGIQRHVTGCMWCQNGCSMIIHIKNKKAVFVTGNPDDPLTKGKICVKPLGSIDLLNSPHRLTYPLKRINGRGNKAAFVRLSWEDALDEIAEKLKHIKENFGGESLGIWASGRSAADSRYLNKGFAKLFGTPNYEKTGPFCNYAGKPAGVSVVGTRNTPWTYSDDDFFAADIYIMLGSNMAATRPVVFSRIKERCKKRECKLIVIDPRHSESCKMADLWLPIRPGTDMALGLSMIHFILKNQLVDLDFVRNYTVGYDQFRSEILSRNYDLDWGAKVTDLPKEKIVNLAKIYAGTKKVIMMGNTGVSHHTNAVQTHRVFYFLAAITGHFGEKSMGYSCLNNGGISIGSVKIPGEMIPKTRPELSKNPVGWFESLDNPSYPYKLRALISTGSPLTQWPDQEKIRSYITKLDLSVYNGLTLNINCYYFDYILPAATWVESGGVSPVSDDSRFVWTPRLIKPPGEARPDRWWWIELGKRMGFGDIFRDEFKDPVVLQDHVGFKKGFTVDRFLAKKDNSLRAPINVKEGKVYERDTLFLDKKFPTKSGKIELWTEEMELKFNRYGLTAIPEFYMDTDISCGTEKIILYNRKELILSPFQKNKTFTHKVSFFTAAAEKKEKFPFCLLTGRPSSAIMGHTSHWIKRLNDISPVQFCLIHPEAAENIGVKHGDRAKVSSPYGETVAEINITRRIRKDTVFIPYSYGEKSPFTQWKSVNFLTSMADRCPVSGQIPFKGVSVAIKKIM